LRCGVLRPCYCVAAHQLDLDRAPPDLDLRFFPTRRSSDLDRQSRPFAAELAACRRCLWRRRQLWQSQALHSAIPDRRAEIAECRDRKSTRLNSSHGSTSYAVLVVTKKNSGCSLHATSRWAT